MNPAALNDLVDARAREEVKERGLRLAFHPGEELPWKGIVFKVAVVDSEQIVLKPVRMTAKRAKEVHRGGR